MPGILALAGGSLILVGFLVVFFFEIVLGYYTTSTATADRAPE